MLFHVFRPLTSPMQAWPGQLFRKDTRFIRAGRTYSEASPQSVSINIALSSANYTMSSSIDQITLSIADTCGYLLDMRPTCLAKLRLALHVAAGLWALALSSPDSCHHADFTWVTCTDRFSQAHCTFILNRNWFLRSSNSPLLHATIL